MKTPYIAVLAMMGWYLILPPVTRTWWVGPEHYDSGAQFSRWTIEQSFDKAGACESARLAAERQSPIAADRMGNAVCVATDDSRLKAF